MVKVDRSERSVNRSRLQPTAIAHIDEKYNRYWDITCVSVTSRINALDLEERFPEISFVIQDTSKMCIDNDGDFLYCYHGLYPWLLGNVVDGLTRYMLGWHMHNVFPPISRIKDINSKDKRFMKWKKKYEEVISYLECLEYRELNNEVIRKMIWLSQWHNLFRGGKSFTAMANEWPNNKINQYTIPYIRALVLRSVEFFERKQAADRYVPFACVRNEWSDMTFNYIQAGDGDYMNNTTIYDMKVSKYDLRTNDNLIQLLCYYYGYKNCHYIRNELAVKAKLKNKIDPWTINTIAVYSPVTAQLVEYKINDIPKDFRKRVLTEVMGCRKKYFNKLFNEPN